MLAAFRASFWSISCAASTGVSGKPARRKGNTARDGRGPGQASAAARRISTMHPICITCGVQFAAAEKPPEVCPICTDERQYCRLAGPDAGPRSRSCGRASRGAARRGPRPHRDRQRTPALRSVSGAVGAGTPRSANVLLWDCISLIDDDAVRAVKAAGRHRRDRDLASAFLRRDGRVEPGVRRADLPARRRPAMGDAPRPSSFLGRRKRGSAPGLTLSAAAAIFPARQCCTGRPARRGRGALLTAISYRLSSTAATSALCTAIRT